MLSRVLRITLLVLGAGMTPLAAQVRCFVCGDRAPSYLPNLMIDYGRSKAQTSRGWQPAEITETSVTWITRVPTGTYYSFFDRYTGQYRSRLESAPGYTNPPYTTVSQCRELTCSRPKY